MVQTIVVALMILAGAVLVQMNSAALGAAVTLTVPGTGTVTATVLQIVAVAVGTLVVAWLAGQVDQLVWSARVRRRESAVRSLQGQVAEVKATAYDQQPSVMDVSLGNVHRRLERIEQQVDALRRTVDRDAPVPADVQTRHAVMG